MAVYLTGDFARGKDSKTIELILIGADIDREYLDIKVAQAEEIVGRKVSYIVLEPFESIEYLSILRPQDLLPLWKADVDEMAFKLT